MQATILFPGDYFSLNSPNDNFTSELDAVISTGWLTPVLFNYDQYIAGEKLALNKEIEALPKMLIYRGWMMKPQEYKKFYSDLVELGFEPLTTPENYEAMHCFFNATILEGLTPKYLTFSEANGAVHIDADIINKTFKRFMVKDFVKSVKGTSFPQYIETPITQHDLDELIQKFMDLRGSLFTGGIILKEFVDLKKYDGVANEWRQFVFGKDFLSRVCRNSLQPSDCPKPPIELLDTASKFTSPFFTIDYAELEDGSWAIIETGDGQVSGLAEADSPVMFYEKLSPCIRVSTIEDILNGYEPKGEPIGEWIDWMPGWTDEDCERAEREYEKAIAGSANEEDKEICRHQFVS